MRGHDSLGGFSACSMKVVHLLRKRQLQLLHTCWSKHNLLVSLYTYIGTLNYPDTDLVVLDKLLLGEEQIRINLKI